MEREDHMNKLRNKLNSKSVIEDMDALWNELEPRLPKQNNNRRVFFWLPIAGILLVVFSLIIYLMPTEEAKQSDVTATTKVVYNQPTSEKPSNNISSEILSPTNSKTNTETSISKSKSTKATVPKRNGELGTNNSRRPQSRSVNEEPALLKDNNNITASKNQATIITNAKITAISQENIQDDNPQKIEQETITTTKQNSDIIKDQIAGKQSKIKLVTDNNKIGQEENVKPLLFPTLSSLGINNLAIEELYTSILDVKAPNYAIISETRDDASDINWKLNLSTYALADWNFRSQQGFSEYGSRINELTSIMPGYTFGGLLSIKSKHGLIFGLAMEQIRTFEKFKLDNSISTAETVLNEEAFLFKGQFIGNEQEVTRTVSQSALSYNEYAKTNLMPFIGYGFESKINYEFTFAPIISVRQNYSGYLIDENDLITADLNHLYLTDKTMLNGYALSADISHHFMNNVQLGLRTQFRRMSKNIPESNTDFDLSLSSLSFGLKLGYDF